MNIVSLNIKIAKSCKLVIYLVNYFIKISDFHESGNDNLAINNPRLFQPILDGQCSINQSI